MYHKHAGLSVIYIALGLLLIVTALGEWLLKVGLALIGIYLINQGMAMRGNSSLHFLYRWFDQTRYY